MNTQNLAREMKTMHEQPSADRQAAIDRLLSTTLEVFGLPARAPWHEDVRFFVGVIADCAALVQSVDLGDRAEPAPVYQP
ncbi:DUF4089 domain-containing protein [Xylophilus rhododendri]|uniref:DUF4089 domain-containing protein n=1 Tax=Xylophilus rhododendri TaxID=2697032 RepID=A0A857J8L9_9BURK|nr:AtzG-like protein [Xylophilus rhododendri]QHI99125.1 DUF4089 domain-containing protein [Xylophilus rhododendri]